MIRVAPWEVEEAGKKYTLRPLTVRERIALGEDLAEIRARAAISDAKAFGSSPSFAIQAANEAREDARKASTLIVGCFTMTGAAMVLAKSCSDAEGLMASIEPTRASNLALACLGVDVERYEAEARSANPR